MTLLERDERMREEGRKEERVKNRIRVKKSKAIIHRRRRLAEVPKK